MEIRCLGKYLKYLSLVIFQVKRADLYPVLGKQVKDILSKREARVRRWRQSAQGSGDLGDLRFSAENTGEVSLS